MLENLPIQKLSRSKKGKEWGKNTIDYLETMALTTMGSGRSSRKRKLANYDLFNGILDPEDFKYVIDPFDIDMESPARLRHYDKISPKIMLLEGEELKRPFNFRCISRSSDSVSELKEKKKEMLFQSIMQMVASKLNPEQQAEQPQTPQEIEEYMQSDYASLQEVTGQKILEYIVDDQDLRTKFNMGFHDVMCVAEEIYKVDVVGGEPTVRTCNPVDITVIKDPDSQYIDDAFCIIEERYLTLPSVLDEYFDSLTSADITLLEKGGGAGSDAKTEFFIRPFEVVEPDEVGRSSDDMVGLIKVLNCEWRSFRKLGLITYLEDMEGGEAVYHSGREMYDEIVDGDLFKIPEYAEKREGVYYFDGIRYKEVWVNEYWEGTKIGDSIYVNIRPSRNQRRDMENPSKCYSNYCGFIYNARNTESVSLVDRLKAFNYFYNIIYYRIENALAKDKGRVLLMDLAQIPTGEDWELDKWMYYLQSMNIAFINSSEEGYQQSQGQFNQFSGVDMETGRFIDKHIQMLDKLEREMEEISGVLRQRMGSTGAYEAVTNAQQNLVQSSHITELWFYNHNQVKRRVLEAVIHCAKQAWKGGKKINYILGDMSRILLEIDDDFTMAEHGVFVSDSSEDTQALEAVKSLITPAIQSGNTLLSEAAEISKDKSMAKITAKLRKGELRREQQAKGDAARLEFEQLKMQKEEERNIRDNETKIQVALIGKNEGSEEFPDVNLDDEKLELEREKLDKGYELKERQLEEAERKNREAEKIAREKIRQAKIQKKS